MVWRGNLNRISKRSFDACCYNKKDRAKKRERWIDWTKERKKERKKERQIKRKKESKKDRLKERKKERK